MSIHTLRKNVQELPSSICVEEYVMQVWVQTGIESEYWKGSFRPDLDPEGIYTREEITTRNRELERENFLIPCPVFIGRLNIGTVRSEEPDLPDRIP